jgi:hypothetical protein
VINASRNNAAAPNATVQLVRMDEQTAEPKVLKSAKTNAQGDFDLGRIDVPADDLLFARVEWAGYPYIAPAYDGGQQLQGVRVQPERLDLPVFDTTTEPPNLGFTVHHVAVKVEGQNLKCIERIVVENTTNKTFVGEGKDGITILPALPKGARDVKLDPRVVDAKLHKFNSVYGISKPIMPEAAGQRNAVIIEYTMPFTKQGVDLSRRLQYATRFFFVAREESDKELKIEAPKLGPDETQQLPIDGDMQSRIVNVIGSPQAPDAALKPGDEVKIVVSRPTNWLVWAFVGFVGALCAVVPLTMLRRRRPPIVVTSQDDGESVVNTSAFNTSNGATTVSGDAVKIAEPTSGASVNGRIHTAGALASESLEMPSAAREWIEKLARLDEDWEAGKLDREEYQQRRAAWKTKLIELLSTSGHSNN